jgi:APA family basic amino acid/polyamine antiporter
VVPVLFIVAAAVLLVFSFADQPLNSVIGTVIILLGIPLHYYLQRRSASRN